MPIHGHGADWHPEHAGAEHAGLPPVDLLIRLRSTPVLILGGVALLIATLSVNVAANIVSPAYDFVKLFPRTLTSVSVGIITTGWEHHSSGRQPGQPDIGVKLALDDFGTGYSSLGYLRRFPVDSVKIDQEFVANLGHDTASHTIVTAVIQLAHGLGMTVVCEGVETAEQHHALTALGCDSCQGFYHARPTPNPASAS